jgi:hypothetical protein
MTESDWVEVTFLWLGADSAATQAAQPAPAPPPAEQQPAPAAPDEVVVDDGGAGYSAEAAIKWYDEGCGASNHHAWTYGTPDAQRSENRARWSAQLPGAGFYEALVHIPNCGPPATRAARYQVSHDGTTREVQIDQSAAAGQWVSLGIEHVVDPMVSVDLTDVTGDEGLAVRFDAVKWVPRQDAAPPDARVMAATPADGGLLVRWAGTDDVSGVASFDVQVRKLPDGGWADWQAGATTLDALFVPPEAGGYAFRARARDWVGHEQPWRAEDDLQLTL